MPHSQPPTGPPSSFSGPSPTPSGGAAAIKPAIDLKPTQLAGGALAAVTSAVAASYFGVTGTVVGAAFGSVVSSVAAAFYATSLNRASERIKTVVVAPVVTRTGAATSDPTAVPGELSGATSTVLDETMLLPNGQPWPTPEQPQHLSPSPHRSALPPPAEPAGSAPLGGSAPPGGRARIAASRAPVDRRRLIKPALVLGGFAFAASLGAITASELALGHPIAAANRSGETSLGVTIVERGSPPSPKAPATQTPSASSSTATSPPETATDSTSPSSPSSSAPESAGASSGEPSTTGSAGAGGGASSSPVGTGQPTAPTGDAVTTPAG